MSTHRTPADASASLATGAYYGTDPGNNGTLDITGKSGLIFRISGAQTVLMPAEDSVPIGTTVTVMNTGTGDVTVTDDASSTIAIIEDEESCDFRLCETSGENKWLAHLYSFNIT